MPMFYLTMLPTNPPPGPNGLPNGPASQPPRSPRQQPVPARLRLASQSHQQYQQPQLVCTWSVHTTSKSGPSPFPRNRHTLTATATAACELFLFGGYVNGSASSNLYVFSTRDFSTTLLQTSGEIPTPRAAHGAVLVGTTLLICGGVTSSGDENVLNHDSLYLLNLGTSDPFMLSLTPADHSFALQYRASGPTLWSMVPVRAVATTIP
jgi:hypothetical protein